MNNLVQVKISGLNLIRIIDKLISKNVPIYNLTRKPKYIKFTISENRLDILNKICKNEHKFYKILQKNGFKQLIYKLPYMLGSFLIFILSYIYFFSTSLFINNVNISYNSNLTYNLENVKRLLSSNGINSGMKKNKYSISDIQNLIMLNIDDIEGCKVEYSGNNLDICVFPSVNKYENNTEDLYSNFDAVIESAEAYSGVLKVKKGDIVKKGDLLIENDLGASGKIKGKVYFTATKIYNEKQQNIIYTGNEYHVREYEVFDKIIIKSNKKCNFKQYLVEKHSFYINKNLFIPIKCNKIIYKEVKIEDIYIPFDSVEEETKKSVFEIAKSKVNDETSITNVTYSVVRDGSYVRIDCFIEAVIDLI